MFVTRKNHELLLEAFVREFNGDPNVKLKIQGRCGNPQPLLDYVRRFKLQDTVELIMHKMGRAQYSEFMASIDCYVCISQGEGFSLTPREALVCGIPCIVSNNTAHKTVCKTGLVKVVETPIAVPALYDGFYGPDSTGYHYTCTVEDVQKALREVYNNYDYYLDKASSGRAWVENHYAYDTLRDYYVSLIKPRQVRLGNSNIIGSDFLQTNCDKLYEKYKKLVSRK
jgi:glycosyltransferase involved in cell wall biosynthesis